MATGVQEYCNGGSLRAAINSGLFRPPKLKHRWEPVMGVLRGIAEGMAYVHSKRICHGDLNPANVLLKVLPPPGSTSVSSDTATGTSRKSPPPSRQHISVLQHRNRHKSQESTRPAAPGPWLCSCMLTSLSPHLRLAPLPTGVHFAAGCSYKSYIYVHDAAAMQLGGSCATTTHAKGPG